MKKCRLRSECDEEIRLAARSAWTWDKIRVGEWIAASILMAPIVGVAILKVMS